MTPPCKIALLYGQGNLSYQRWPFRHSSQSPTCPTPFTVVPSQMPTPDSPEATAKHHLTRMARTPSTQWATIPQQRKNTGKESTNASITRSPHLPLQEEPQMTSHLKEPSVISETNGRTIYPAMQIPPQIQDEVQIL